MSTDDDDRVDFSVAVFFPDGSWMYEARWVGAKEAVETMKRMTETVGARTGMVSKVIVTDGGDYTVAQWEFGKGITFPPRDQQSTKGD
jgi:hypothetical protein